MGQEAFDMTVKLEARLDIVRAARENTAFRREVATGDFQQVVVMTIPLEGEIGEEVHPRTDQLLIFLDGRGEARLNGVTSAVAGGDVVFVPAGVRHNFLNRGDGPMRLVSIYGPPEHAPGTVHLTRAEAEAAEA
jgi:mannose-6-phosphate isomerase-like protein (cupin superfamily)